LARRSRGQTTAAVKLTPMTALLGRALGGAAALGEAAIGGVAPVWPAVAQGRVMSETAHRPWPLPSEPWTMAQTWGDLLFAHWPVPERMLRPLVPEPLAIDTFDGVAWLGITPFEVSGLRLRGTVPLPRLSRFPEVNVRTYASFGGKPGIWFFSLDAGRASAVAGARATYRLPYYRAAMTIGRSNQAICYRSSRRSPGATLAELAVEYAPAAAPRPAPAGTLEHWLVERYCLYTLDRRGRVMRAEIHHPPWPLQPATATFEANTMAPEGIVVPAQVPLLHFARRQYVVIWPLRTAA
jgi:uncharacterized protein YqjF (DUF2071 family)